MPIDASIPLSGIAPKITSPAQLMSLRDLAAQTRMRESELDYLPKKRRMAEQQFDLEADATRAKIASQRYATEWERQQKDDEFRKGVRNKGLNTILVGKGSGYADNVIENNMRTAMLADLEEAKRTGKLSLLGVDDAEYERRKAAIMNATVDQIMASQLTQEQALEQSQYPAAGGQQPQPPQAPGMPMSQIGQPPAMPPAAAGEMIDIPNAEPQSQMTPVPEGATDREWWLARNADLTRMGLQNMRWDPEAVRQTRELEKGQSVGNRDFPGGDTAGLETIQAPSAPTEGAVSLQDVSRGAIEPQAPWDALDAEADADEAKADAKQREGGISNYKEAERLRAAADKKRARAEQLRDNDRDERRLAAQKEAKFGGSNISLSSGELSPGWKKVDEKAAEEFTEFVVAGGAADVEKNVGQLEESLKQLEESDELTGIFIGNLPAYAQEAFFPRAVAVREQIEEVVQRNLRLVLGAQFTEKEGERLIARAFNQRLPEAENAKRVKRLMMSIKRAAEAKQAAWDYFTENGTMRGFKGRRSFTVGDFERELPDPVFANNPKTGKQVYTIDGGKTWQTVTE